MAKQNEIATTDENQLAVTPDWMKNNNSMQGLEDFGVEDMATPRLKLLQATSPEVTDGDSKAGELFHTLVEEALNKKGPLRVVPVFIQKKFFLWKPQHDGGGILARAEDAVHWSPSEGEFTVHPVKGDKETVTWKLAKTVKESRLDQWGTSDPRNPNSPPAATQMYCFVLWFPDFPHMPPAVLTLQRSTTKVAQKWIGRMKVSGAPIYGQVFTLDVVKETVDGQDFKSLKVVPSGFVDEKTFKELKSVHENFVSQGLRIKDEGSLEGEGVVSDTLPDGAPEL